MNTPDSRPLEAASGLDGGSLHALLNAFSNRQRAVEAWNRIASFERIGTHYREVLRTWLERVARSADPDESLNHLDRILHSGLDPIELMARLSLEPEAMEILLAIAGQSPFLSEIVIREPGRLLWLLDSEDLRETKRWPHYRTEIASLLEDCASGPEQAAQLLRRYRNREILRIAVRDILGLGKIEDCALELSNLADNLVSESCRQVRADYRERFGCPLTGEGKEAQFAVIALGKLGGRELNFSSDIDLMFVYEGEGKPENKPGWDNFVYFSKLAVDLVALLTASTDEGCLYRVDTRLRPEGAKGALVRSLPSMELYYESWGENWERQALLRARPVAGDPELGEKFLKTIRPFTFRKYVDQIGIQETLQAMSAMRTRTIQVHGSTVRSGAVNVKTDPGGIRDVEFAVQAVQMLYGGQYPEIRCAGTLESLQRMWESGLLRSEDYRSLSEGYRFLRRVEHRLQMEKGLQVYTLPADSHRMEVFARRMGFDGRRAFQNAWKNCTSNVHRIYQGIFAPFEQKDALEVLFLEEEGDALLRSSHLSDVRRARGVFRILAQDPDSPHLNPKIRRLFRKILPRLLESIRQAPNSEVALGSFERIVSAVGARSSFYTVLGGNPQLLELLISLGGHSKYLTDILVRFPSLLDRLSDPAFLHEPLNRERLVANHEIFRSGMPDVEPLELLRRLKRTLLLKVGLRYLLRLSDISRLTEELTALAEYVVQQVVVYWSERYNARYGMPRLSSGLPCRMAVIGMGKLGGGELGLSSDLDLLFVYESDEGEIAPASPESPSIGIKEYHVRLASEVLKTLAARSQEGALYESDVRLRPYGKGGDLSGTLRQYRDYYAKEAALWERQALTRARWIAGDGQLGQLFIDQAAEFVYGQGLSGEQKAQIAHLRGRIERERKGEAIKSGEGGLVDVEFLVQALQLEFGKDAPEVRVPHTLKALDALAAKGLYPPGDARKLAENYLFLRDILNRLQIADGISIQELPRDREDLEELIRRMDHLGSQAPPSGRQFLERYDACRKEIRAQFQEYFQA